MSKPPVTLHHSHFVTDDVDGFCAFFTRHFDAEIVFDQEIDGDRNVFLKIGTGRMHLFQSRHAPARDRNVFHHIGLMAEDLDATVARLTGEGLKVGPITRVQGGGFAMVKGPDGLLMELFEVRTHESRRYFVD